ncbi:sushi, von Willebrand factor type A, EGF and pentraxin domain-containing protein 1-like [Patiria miniata]|uniref:Sushi repeat-containing protein SRPX2 n=1 Tax=Patiria miniata TaxID=46514 RepID=A0A913ZVG0_PATMI|nr:sushi, von Willebrand factor type A, EGF and pentraxin domain-containing protein 1-like [Patiria miniata]
MEPKTSLVAAFVLCLLLVPLQSTASADRQPPVLVQGTCPSDIVRYADHLSTSTSVHWTKPRASDASLPITVQRKDGGPANGGYFSASRSPYTIRYSARDSKGNKNDNLCTFTVAVKVRRCGVHPPVTWGAVSCSHGDIFGSECSISCMSGYSIRGSSRRTCQSNRMWSGTTPSCAACGHVNNPFRGNLNCQVAGEEQNCTISCWQGYAFSRAILPSYQCGPSTDYKWSHETDDNQGLALPKCTKCKPPIKVAMEMTLVYSNNLTCDGVNVTKDSLAYQRVNDTITMNLQMLSCVQNNSCAVKHQISGCSPHVPGDHARRRRRRSLEAVHITIRLERDVDIPDQQNLTNEEVVNQHSFIEATDELRNSAGHLINQSRLGQFAINVDSQVYDVDLGKTKSYGMPVCPPGTVRMEAEDVRCVPCESGWYNYLEDCYPCPRGMYQSLEGSTYCQACPRGRTTTGPRASEEADCKVIVQ